MNYYTIIIINLFIWLPCLLIAQSLPSVFPEDLRSHNMSQIKCFCKPGVRYASKSKGVELAYSFTGGGKFTSQDSFIVQDPASQYRKWESLNFKINFPIVNKDNFKLLLGYKYEAERLSFQQVGVDYSETFGELDNNNLKSNAISLIAVKPINEKYYTIFRLHYNTNGNYDGWADFSNDYAIYKGLAAFGVKKTELFEYGFGVSMSKSFRSTSIIPFLIYNRTFNEKWGIESIFPSYVFGRYNINEKNVALFGIEFDSQSYRLKIDNGTSEPLDYAMNHSEFLTSFRWESQLSDWFWLNVKAGYRMNFSTDFESKTTNSPFFTSDPTNGAFFRVGIFLSPPAKFLK